ncbi:MAG: potassium channel protein [Ardenticatenaceae bacterium]|nr:MAG: potassium channel protein [Ardenticatenaceae bacterium]
MLTWIIASISSVLGGVKQLHRSSLLPLLLPFLLLILVGTVVYSLLEGWTLFDSLYATIITITTVGYGDLSPQSQSGRIFAIFFTLFAIGLAGYAISSAAAILFETQQQNREKRVFEKRMNDISKLSNHIIVCGGSIIGNRAAGEFKRRQFPFVIIEPDEEKLKRALLWMHESYVDKRLRHYESLDEVDWSIEERMSIDELARDTGILYMLEDPTEEQQLRTAGVHRAYGVVAAMEDDRDNTTIILSARDMGKRLNNSKLRIVGSARDEMNMHTLYLAGADRVVAPNIMGGFTLATNMLDHDAAEFWDNMFFQQSQNIRFGDIHVREYPHIVGWTADELRQKMAQLVIAIRRNGGFLHMPAPEEVILAEDVLIVIGNNLQ